MARTNPQRGATTTPARPQQPTDSHAASLPTETLAQILESSLEGLNAWERQQARMSFARVCAGWYGAVDLGRELAVKDTNMAERCARSLAQKSSQQKARIRSLTIRIEGNCAGRGERASKLVKACPQLEAVELLGLGRLLGTSGHALGAPLTEALKRQVKVKTFKLEHSTSMRLGGGDLLGIISWWPELAFLLLPNLQPCTWSQPGPFATPQTRLAELHLPLRGDSQNNVADALLKSGLSTLRYLDLGTFSSTSRSLAQISTGVKTSLASIAPQLYTLKAVFEFASWRVRTYTPSDVLTPMLSALRDVESLSLGVLGFDLSAILPLLQPLLRLRTLSIGQSKLDETQALFHQITSQATIHCINGAVALKALTLPRQLEQVWTKNDLELVKGVAEQKGVCFMLG